MEPPCRRGGHLLGYASRSPLRPPQLLSGLPAALLTPLATRHPVGRLHLLSGRVAQPLAALSRCYARPGSPARSKTLRALLFHSDSLAGKAPVYPV